MKKTSLIIVFIFAAVALVAVAATIWTRSQSSWEFVRRVTGLEFPADTEYLAQYDNAEWFVVAIVRLPEASVPTFIREHRFTTGNRPDMSTALALPKKYREIPSRADLLSVSAQKEYQAWQAIFDPQSRLLWIHVAYPDSAGDHPGTAPQPQRPNKAPEPTPTSVTSPAAQEPRQP